MTTPHITKTRSADYPFYDYEHARHDYKPCLTVVSVENTSQAPSNTPDLRYAIDLPLRVRRSDAWLRIAEPFDLSGDTTFGKFLLERLNLIEGVMAIPHHNNDHRISVWVPGAMTDRYCKPEVAELVRNLPDSIWLSIEYAVHRHESPGRRIGEFMKRL